jgi:hypothetical protein
VTMTGQFCKLVVETSLEPVAGYENSSVQVSFLSLRRRSSFSPGNVVSLTGFT